MTGIRTSVPPFYVYEFTMILSSFLSLQKKTTTIIFTSKWVDVGFCLRNKHLSLIN